MSRHTYAKTKEEKKNFLETFLKKVRCSGVVLKEINQEQECVTSTNQGTKGGSEVS